MCQELLEGQGVSKPLKEDKKSAGMMETKKRSVPCGPGKPLGPVAPLTPLGPAGPGSPLLPLAPSKPGRPSDPLSPLGPASPLGPGVIFMTRSCLIEQE